MIEELLRVFARLGFTSKPNTFGNGAIDQIRFRCRFEDFVERSVGRLFVDFLQPEISLQTSATDGSLAQPQAGVTLRKLCIVEIAVLAQSRDDFLNICLSRAAPG